MDDFIGVYDIAETDKFCKKVFEHLDNIKMGDRLNPKITNTEYFLLQEKDKTLLNFNVELLKQFMEIINVAYNHYMTKYQTAMDSVHKMSLNTNIKLQKVGPSQGYHVWHSENDGLETCSRSLFFLMYLNDVEEGGETEFLYQRKRVDPKEGRLVLAPAAWTHQHRGNPTLKGDKYIITGWSHYVE